MTPPKTTLENFFYIPRLEQLLLWFLKNDKQVSLVASPTVKRLFDDGLRPESSSENDLQQLENEARKNNQSANTQIIESWLVIRTWMDLNVAMQQLANRNVPLDRAIEAKIDLLG